MQLLNNMNVGKKITLLVMVLLIFLATIAIMGIKDLRLVSQETSILYKTNYFAVSAVKEANINLIYQARAVRNIAIMPERRATELQAYDKFEANFRREMGSARERLVTPAIIVMFDKVMDAYEDVVPVQREIMLNADNRTLEENAARIYEAAPIVNKADNLITEVCNLLEEASDIRFSRIESAVKQALIINISILFAALIFGAIFGLLIKKAIANPLVSISGKASLVAGGDLSQQFLLNRKDELGSLSSSLDQMVVNLRARIAEAEQKSREAAAETQKANEAMVEANTAKAKAEEGQRAILEAAANVEVVVNRLSTATEQLSAQVEQSSRGADMQRERVTSSATAMEEMNSTILEVARNAGTAAKDSEDAKNDAVKGQSIVQQSIASINVVQADTDKLEKNMEELGKQAEAIGDIMTVISDIADQTNLLALNAAIEAARAGEAGRGFAVVADEVRKLAEKTMQATKEVGAAIKGIQTGTRQSIDAVVRTTGNLHTTTELVERSGESLVSIVTGITEAAVQVSSIATAADEQSAASEEITHALDEIHRMADETAKAMQQSAQAVGELAMQSHELQRLVNQLRKS